MYASRSACELCPLKNQRHILRALVLVLHMEVCGCGENPFFSQRTRLFLCLGEYESIRRGAINGVVKRGGERGEKKDIKKATESSVADLLAASEDTLTL